MKKKDKTPSAKTLRGRRSAPSKKKKKVLEKGRVGYRMVVKKPLRVKVGRYYRNRAGKVIGPMVLDREHAYGDTHPYRATYPGNTYAANGNYLFGEKRPEDLIREVPSPKAKKRGGK